MVPQGFVVPDGKAWPEECRGQKLGESYLPLLKFHRSSWLAASVAIVGWFPLPVPLPFSSRERTDRKGLAFGGSCVSAKSRAVRYLVACDSGGANVPDTA